MENFKHLPEPFRIRVIEPVKRTTRAYREEAIIKSGMNPFLQRRCVYRFTDRQRHRGGDAEHAGCDDARRRSLQRQS